jgi:hypothetical protein
VSRDAAAEDDLRSRLEAIFAAAGESPSCIYNVVVANREHTEGFTGLPVDSEWFAIFVSVGTRRIRKLAGRHAFAAGDSPTAAANNLIDNMRRAAKWYAENSNSRADARAFARVSDFERACK